MRVCWTGKRTHAQLLFVSVTVQRGQWVKQIKPLFKTFLQNVLYLTPSGERFRQACVPDCSACVYGGWEFSLLAI